MSYSAYLLITIGLPRDHHSLFIQTSFPSRSGYIYQVSGNIQTGMFFNQKSAPLPSEESDFISMTQIGSVRADEFEIGTVRDVVESVGVPKKQFDGSERLFPQEPLRRCQEWMTEVVEKLSEEGILERPHASQCVENETIVATIIVGIAEATVSIFTYEFPSSVHS